ncbi:hypothetical protein [Dapis sp. BLCC M172]|uniref:hypothetical protein n=1 Tax=Dapis sp. BLCC M172 TaxID=2975281 RepID=UPI003CEFC705
MLIWLIFRDIKVNIECKKSPNAEIYCQLHRTNILKQQTQTFLPGELKGATLNRYTDEDGNSYQIMLKTKKGNILFGMSDGSIRSKQEKVNQINNFIEDSNITLLNVEKDDTVQFFWDLISCGYIVAISLWVMLLVMIQFIRERLTSILNQMNKPPKKALLSLEEKPQE